MGVAGMVMVAAVAAATDGLGMGDLLYREDGVLEMVSLGLWVLSCVLAWALASRASDSTARLVGLWTGWLAALAALRELDAHVWLNPKYLGAMGVRFRLDWWLSGEVSVWLKLGWGLLLVSVVVAVAYPGMKLRGVLWERFRGSEPAVRLFVVAVVFLAVGYVIDDILRPVRSVSSESKRMVEELSETIGAALYFSAVVWPWRTASGTSRQRNQVNDDVKDLAARHPKPG